MISTDKISIKIGTHNYKKYPSNNIGDIVDIHPSELPNGSKYEVDCKCDKCGVEKTVKWNLYWKNYGSKYDYGYWLCRKCKLKENNLEKYGVENVFQLDIIKEKSKQTVKEKYGVDNVSQLNETKEKVKATNIEKYGVEHYNQLEENKRYGEDNINSKQEIIDLKKDIWKSKSDEEISKISEKRIKTNKERYNIDYTFKLDDIKDKIRKTNLEKYGHVNPSMNNDIKDKIITTMKLTHDEKSFINIDDLVEILDDSFYINCVICDSVFEISKPLYYKRNEYNTTICTNCNPISKNVSGKEIELLNFIKGIYNGEIIENDRSILEGKELDIYLPEKNIAFEFNGLYWHSELYKDNKYHYSKYKRCKEKGVELFQIYEDSWDNNKDLVKSMIINKLGLTKNKLYARKCEVKVIDDNDILKSFLNENHIQGYVSSSYKIGLYHNDELVSLLLFTERGNYIDLVRFCNKKGFSVIGGFSKLLKNAIKIFNFDKDITTFSNNDYSYGGLYESNGFEYMNDLRVDYSYIVNSNRVHKFNFRKSKLKYECTEREYTQSLNLYRIYDSGKVKWIYKLSNIDFKASS